MLFLLLKIVGTNQGEMILGAGLWEESVGGEPGRFAGAKIHNCI